MCLLDYCILFLLIGNSWHCCQPCLPLEIAQKIYALLINIPKSVDSLLDSYMYGGDTEGERSKCGV